MRALKRKDRIADLQKAVLAMPQVELETKHFFADGMYLRWLFRPKGTLIVGKVHKKEHFYLVVQGSVRIAGEPPQTLSAPAVLVCPPGTKRAVYALEDSICLTVHRTAEKELEKIEMDLVEPDASALFGPGNVLKRKEIESCVSS